MFEKICWLGFMRVWILHCSRRKVAWRDTTVAISDFSELVATRQTSKQQQD